MKKMSMAQAMSKAIEKVDSLNESQITRVFPMAWSGNKENGYDRVLVGVETSMVDGKDMIYFSYEISVRFNFMTGWKPEVETIKVEEERF